MGWKTVESPKIKTKEFCNALVEANELPSFTILDSAFYNNYGYYLVQHPSQNSPEYMQSVAHNEGMLGKVEILVVTTMNQRNPATDSRTWSYKIELEQEVDGIFTCPKRMLEKSENKNIKAIQWRTKCHEKHDQKNKHRSNLRSKCKLIGKLTKGLVIESDMYGPIIFDHCVEGEKSVLIGYLVKSPVKRLQFQINLISEEELRKALNLEVTKKPKVEAQPKKPKVKAKISVEETIA